MTAPARLPVDEHRRLYLAQILPEALASSAPSSAPQAIITGGQPGSGKSRLAIAAREEFRHGHGCVTVDADICREVHPQYAHLARQDPRTAADRTHADAAAWATQLTRDAVQARRNLVIDQTSRDSQALGQLLDQLKANGYRTELRVMAVPYEVSLQRIHSRFETHLQSGALARFSSRQSHDHAWQGLADTVRASQAWPHLDSIAVYDLAHRQIHRSDRSEGTGVQSAQGPQTFAAFAAFSGERGRALTLTERRDLVARWDHIAAQLQRPGRHASTQEIEAVDSYRAAAARRLDLLVFGELPRDQALRERPNLAGAYKQLDDELARLPRVQRTEEQQRHVIERVARAIIAGPGPAPDQSPRLTKPDRDPER